jgi:hypothetical protein
VFDYCSYHRISSALDGRYRWTTEANDFTDLIGNHQWVWSLVSHSEERTEMDEEQNDEENIWI